MISSVSGSVSGIPSVALYSATKAFENSLAVGLAKEMEASGVGITCMMPGAVRGTDFQSGSRTDDALCWKIPFYAKSPHSIAEMGVRSMLRGDSEVTPGYLNRIFIKVVKPVLPQRLHNLVAEMVWNPLRLPFRRPKDERDRAQAPEREILTPPPPAPHQSLRPPQFNYRFPPRLLETEDVETDDMFEDDDEEFEQKDGSEDGSAEKTSGEDDLSPEGSMDGNSDSLFQQTEDQIKERLEEMLQSAEETGGNAVDKYQSHETSGDTRKEDEAVDQELDSGSSRLDPSSGVSKDTSDEYEELQAPRPLER